MFDRRQVITGLALLSILIGYVLLSPDRALAVLGDISASPWFPIILIGLYLVRPFLAWPITLLSVLVGYQYGILIGVPIALGGAAATSTIPYTVGRYLRTDEGWLGHLTRGGDRYFTTTGDLRGVIAARLAPTPAEPVSAGAGIAHVAYPAFVLGTLIGELPWTIAAVTIGASLQSATAVSTPTFDPFLILAAVLAALLLLANPVYTAVKHRRNRG